MNPPPSPPPPPDAVLLAGDAEAPPAGSWTRRTFASFAFPNYRWFFFGQGTSVVGMWMKDAAQGWLVFRITGNYAALGLVTGVARGALGVATPLGGAVADRADKRRLLMRLSVLSSILSLALGLLVLAGSVEVWEVAVMAGLSGAVKGFEIPTRQAFVVEMVGREHLGNAIVLNTAMFNSARVLGPLMAGFIMGASETGIAICFLADGLSYLAILFSLARIRPLPAGSDRSGAGMAARLLEGVRYSWNDRRTRTLMLLLLVFVTFGWSYLTILPAFANRELGLGERGFGLMMALNGLGALLGALWVASRPVPLDRRARRRTVFGAVLLSGAAVAAFGIAPGAWGAGAALVVAGFGGVGFLSRGNALVQTAVPDDLRGRVMGLWALVFIGGMALGGTLIGLAAEAAGAPAAIVASGALCVAASGAVWLGLPPAGAGQGVGPRPAPRAPRNSPPPRPGP